MLKAFADYITHSLFKLPPQSHLGEALNFFIYDTLKIFLMLALIIYAVSIIRSFFPPERTRKILSRHQGFFGNILAALLGVVTPFCSCSAVPVFIGFLEAGIPLGVTFSFLISSPMVNEVALVLLWGLFGWKIALIYTATGLTVAVLGGFTIGKLKLEHLVEDYVYQIRVGDSAAAVSVLSWAQRFLGAREYTKDILRRVWLYVLVGIGAGAIIHGYAPVDLVATYAGKSNPLAVPLAVLIGVPLYSNAAGTIPIVQALMGKGLPIGTVLAFMMSITALSFPELVILRKVLKVKMLFIFVGILTPAIIAVGYLFNLIL